MKWKLIFPFLAVLLVGAGGTVVLRSMKERSAMFDDLDRRARAIAASLAPAAARYLKTHPNVDEEDLAERLSEQGRTRGVLLCTLDGQTIARSSGLAEVAIDCQDSPLQTVGEHGQEVLLSVGGTGHLRGLVSPIKSRAGEFLGTLTIIHDTSYIHQRVTSALTWTMFTVALVALCISIGTHLWSRRSLERSVEKLLLWMEPSKGTAKTLPPTESLLKPVAREVEKLSARLRSARETAVEVAKAKQQEDVWNGAKLKAHALHQLGNHPLIVVSNREPYMHVKELGRRKVIVPAGGLVTALDPVLRATNGIWVAHGAGDADWDVTDPQGKLLVPPEAPSYTLKRVRLSKEEEEGYYYGFSNEALWPLCHLTHHRPRFDERDWEAYQQVNRLFAKAIVSECKEERPFILVQDYHFTLLPRYLRELRPDAVIGLFWHIPWPTPEAFQVCPWKREILEGMIGADFVGFHLQSYCNNFLDTVNTLLPSRIDWERFSILHDRGTTAVKPFPISVQPWSERNVPEGEELQHKIRQWREDLELGDRRLVVSVDRIDYTKGIPERIGAIDHLLERYPELRTKVCFVQLGAPSRVHIPRYRELITEIETQVDQVNWKHTQQGWKPIIFLKAHHDAATVSTFYRMADVCIVSSLADGMNLVAKEYVAARDTNDGVLIVSEFTGAARELQDALHINPYARTDFAEAIRIALAMPLEEQRTRMIRLRSQVAEKNVYRWAGSLLSELATADQARPQQKVSDS